MKMTSWNSVLIIVFLCLHMPALVRFLTCSWLWLSSLCFCTGKLRLSASLLLCSEVDFVFLRVFVFLHGLAAYTGSWPLLPSIIPISWPGYLWVWIIMVGPCFSWVFTWEMGTVDSSRLNRVWCRVRKRRSPALSLSKHSSFIWYSWDK